MDDAFSNLICERALSTQGDKKVTVQVTAPRRKHSDPNDTREDAYCLYRIVGIGSGKRRKVSGVDGVQALQLVMEAIGAELYASDEARSGHLKWDAGNVPGDLGFPVPSGLEELVPVGASAQ